MTDEFDLGPSVLVAVDIEGVAGVWRPEQTRPGNPDYESARRWMTNEANAAVLGAFEAGAASVLVNDSHGHFGNLLAHELDPRAELIQGKPRRLGMMAGVDASIDAVMMIGWHAMAGSGGVLAHTTNSSAFAQVLLNDQPIGEIGLYAGVAAEHGAPVVLVSGCSATAHEVTMSMPDVRCVVTKVSEGARTGRSLSPALSCENIHEAAHDSVAILIRDTRARIGKAAGDPRNDRFVSGHIVLAVECIRPVLAELISLWPTVRRVSVTRVEVECATMTDASRCLNLMSALAGSSVIA